MDLAWVAGGLSGNKLLFILIQQINHILKRYLGNVYILIAEYFVTLNIGDAKYVLSDYVEASNKSNEQKAWARKLWTFKIQKKNSEIISGRKLNNDAFLVF